MGETTCTLALISCRICTDNYGEFLTLDSELQSKEILVELYNKTTGLEAKLGDELPQMMCQPCVETLKMVSEFLAKALRADVEFRQMLNEKLTKVSDLEVAKEEQTKKVEIESDQDVESIGHVDPISDEEEVAENVSEIQFCTDKVVLRQEVELLPAPLQEVVVKSEIESTQSSLSEAESVTCNIENSECLLEINRVELTPSPQPKMRKTTRNPVACRQQRELKNRNFKCKECDKRFPTTQKLEQHHIVHTKARDYKCPMCDKRFATIYRKRDHLKTHTNERNFSCEYCDKCFFTRADLKMHTLAHTNFRAHTCEFCGKSFQHASVLKTHMALHVGKNAECDICQRKFSRTSHLNIHKRLHTGERPYKCNQCDSAYMQKSHLDRHMGLHLGIRFSCMHCNKVYTKKSTLDTHVQQEHLRNKVYTCQICEMQFNKQKSYYYHMKKKHPTTQYSQHQKN